MMLEDITARVKSIPPVAWVAGGIIIVAWVLLAGNSSSGGVPSVSGGGDGGASGDGSELENLSRGLVELAEDFDLSMIEQAAWRKGIEGRLQTGAPTRPNNGGHRTPGPSVRFADALRQNKPGITNTYKPSSLRDALKVSGVRPGRTIELREIRQALRKEGINYGATVTRSDVAKLFRRTGITPKTK